MNERDEEYEPEEPRHSEEPYRLRIDPFTKLVEANRALTDRVRKLEVVVYGFCALILCSVVGIWLKLAAVGK